MGMRAGSNRSLALTNVVTTMKQIDLDTAKADFLSLVDSVSKGETFVITISGKPVAKLSPLAEPERKKIKFGALKGKIHMPDDFDAPLPDWLLDAFEGKDEK